MRPDLRELYTSRLEEQGTEDHENVVGYVSMLLNRLNREFENAFLSNHKNRENEGEGAKLSPYLQDVAATADYLGMSDEELIAEIQEFLKANNLSWDTFAVEVTEQIAIYHEVQQALTAVESDFQALFETHLPKLLKLYEDGKLLNRIEIVYMLNDSLRIDNPDWVLARVNEVLAKLGLPKIEDSGL